jgi:hypothetical protein
LHPPSKHPPPVKAEHTNYSTRQPESQARARLARCPICQSFPLPPIPGGRSLPSPSLFNLSLPSSPAPRSVSHLPAACCLLPASPCRPRCPASRTHRTLSLPRPGPFDISPSYHTVAPGSRRYPRVGGLPSPESRLPTRNPRLQGREPRMRRTPILA